MALLLPLMLVGPVLMLATAVVALWAHGPLGWVAAVLLVLAVLWAARALCRLCLRWWRSTKAPVSAGGTGRASAGRPGPPGGTSRG